LSAPEVGPEIENEMAYEPSLPIAPERSSTALFVSLWQLTTLFTFSLATDTDNSLCHHLQNLGDFRLSIVKVRTETNVMASLPILSGGTDNIRGGQPFE
jgi:hypothetical protein